MSKSWESGYFQGNCFLYEANSTSSHLPVTTTNKKTDPEASYNIPINPSQWSAP